MAINTVVTKAFTIATTTSIGDFLGAWWQQTYQVKSIVLQNVRMLRTTQTMEIYLVSLLPPSVPKSPFTKSSYHKRYHTIYHGNYHNKYPSNYHRNYHIKKEMNTTKSRPDFGCH